MWTRTVVALALALPGVAQDRVGIGQLAEIARARAERQRPELEKVLQPFLADLRLEYDRNQGVVDATIEKVAVHGDSIAPLLLEYLTPDNGGREALNLAENSARALARMDMTAFVDTLVELADGERMIPRRHAIWLLAKSDRPAALAALIRNFPRLTDPVAVAAALRAVTDGGSPALRELAPGHLLSSDPRVRAAVLGYLATIDDGSAVPRVLAGLAAEGDDDLIPAYLGYLSKRASRNADAALALLKLLEDGRLDAPTRLAIIRALQEVAPEDHRETRDALRAILEAGETREVGVQIAKLLTDMGDRRARTILFKNLEDQLNERRNNVNVLQDRAYAWFAFERYGDAIDDYKKAIAFSNSRPRAAQFYLKIARCYAHLGRVGQMLDAIDDSGLRMAEIEAEAAEDPVFAEVISNGRVRARLESIVDR